MKIGIQNYRLVSLITLFSFLLLIISSNSIFGLTDVETDESIAIKLMKEAEELYIKGEYQSALDKLKKALSLVKVEKNLERLYFQLSVVFYALGQNSEAEEYMKKMFEIKPRKKIEEEKYPRGYLKMYRTVMAKYPKVPEVPRVKVTEAVRKKRVRSLISTIGILSLAGILYAIIKTKKGLATGRIQINSIPPGAKIYLDDNDTGKTTNNILIKVSVGSHTIKLEKDGYQDYEEDISVKAAQTSIINAHLIPHTITVTRPTSSTFWVVGQEAEIQWITNESLYFQKVKSYTSSFNNLSNTEKNIALSFLKRYRRLNHSFSVPLKTTKKFESKDLIKNDKKVLDEFPEVHHVSRKFSFVEKDINIIHHIKERNQPERINLPSIKTSPQISNPPEKKSVLSIANVKIDLYKGDNFIETIVPNTANDGTYTWPKVDGFLADGTDYKVRVSCSSDDRVYGESDEFEIKKKPVALIDLYHGRDGRNLAKSYGYETKINNSPLDPSSLIGIKVYFLFLPNCPAHSYTTDELTALKDFVDSGGNILVVGGEDFCSDDIANPLLDLFNMNLGDDTLTTETMDIFVSHPITQGVTTITYIGADPISLLSSTPKSLGYFRSGKYIGLAIYEPSGKGKVVVLADGPAGGDTDKLWQNIWNYLR